MSDDTPFTDNDWDNIDVALIVAGIPEDKRIVNLTPDQIDAVCDVLRSYGVKGEVKTEFQMVLAGATGDGTARMVAFPLPSSRVLWNVTVDRKIAMIHLETSVDDVKRGQVNARLNEILGL